MIDFFTILVYNNTAKVNDCLTNRNLQEVNDMKQIVFGIAVILFGFSMAYISIQAQWAIMQALSLLSVFVGLALSILGFIEKDE